MALAQLLLLVVLVLDLPTSLLTEVRARLPVLPLDWRELEYRSNAGGMHPIRWSFV